MLSTPGVESLTYLGMVVVNWSIVVPHAVRVPPDSDVDIKASPEHVLLQDEIGIATVYHLIPRILRLVWLTWWVCEERTKIGGERPV